MAEKTKIIFGTHGRGGALSIPGVGRTPMTRQEGEILFCLMCRPWVNLFDLSEAVWPDPERMPEWWEASIKRRLRLLCAKLEPSEWRIRNWRGVGYALEYRGAALSARGRTAA